MIQAKAITKNRPDFGLIQPLPDSEERTIGTKIDELVKNESVKIILAKSEGDALKAYENMVKTAKQIGLEKYEKWANEQYADKKKLLK